MSDQNQPAYSPDKASKSYMMSALILAALIAAAGFVQFTIVNKEKVLVQAAAGAQQEYAGIERIAMLTAQYQVTHDDILLNLLKQTATDTMQLHNSLAPVVLAAMARGTLTDQENMKAGSIDTKVKDLINKAFSFGGGPDSPDGRADADAIASAARQEVADAWEAQVSSYIAGAQKEIDLFSKIGFGLCGAALLMVFYQLSALFAPAMAQVKAMRDHVEHMGSTDMLTGFYNRAMLFKVVSTLISGARRHKHPLTALAVDIDEFKALNDKYGRAAGDAAIKKVGLALSEVLRTSDVMGRVGGAEFGVFLPSTDEYRASFVAEKLRAAIENLQFNVKDNVVLLRVSIGVGQLQDTHKSTDDVLRAAEYALKTAKDGGRNRVATFSGAAVATTSPGAPPPVAADNAG
jgi:diguanylate cyclase (GGDEF)-like protein